METPEAEPWSDQSGEKRGGRKKGGKKDVQIEAYKRGERCVCMRLCTYML